MEHSRSFPLLKKYKGKFDPYREIERRRTKEASLSSSKRIPGSPRDPFGTFTGDTSWKAWNPTTSDYNCPYLFKFQSTDVTTQKPRKATSPSSSPEQIEYKMKQIRKEKRRQRERLEREMKARTDELRRTMSESQLGPSATSPTNSEGSAKKPFEFLRRSPTNRDSASPHHQGGFSSSAPLPSKTLSRSASKSEKVEFTLIFIAYVFF